MSSIVDRLRQKLNQEDFKIAAFLLGLPPSRIRSAIEEMTEEALKP